MIAPLFGSPSHEIDSSLLTCLKLALEALLSLVSAVLLILLAGARILGAVATLLLAIFSFTFWCFASWRMWIEQWLSYIAEIQRMVKEL